MLNNAFVFCNDDQMPLFWPILTTYMLYLFQKRHKVFGKHGYASNGMS